MTPGPGRAMALNSANGAVEEPKRHNKKNAKSINLINISLCASCIGFVLLCSQNLISLSPHQKGFNSKGRDRIERRARSAGQWNRGCREHEFPSFAFRGGFAQGFEIAIVKDINAQGDEHQLMNRVRQAFDSGRKDVAGDIASQQRHIMLFHPFRG